MTLLFWRYILFPYLLFTQNAYLSFFFELILIWTSPLCCNSSFKKNTHRCERRIVEVVNAVHWCQKPRCRCRDFLGKCGGESFLFCTLQWCTLLIHMRALLQRIKWRTRHHIRLFQWKEAGQQYRLWTCTFLFFFIQRKSSKQKDCMVN